MFFRQRWTTDLATKLSAVCSLLHYQHSTDQCIGRAVKHKYNHCITLHVAQTLHKRCSVSSPQTPYRLGYHRMCWAAHLSPSEIGGAPHWCSRSVDWETLVRVRLRAAAGVTGRGAAVPADPNNAATCSVSRPFFASQGEPVAAARCSMLVTPVVELDGVCQSGSV